MSRPSITQEMRAAVAERYGCRDGETREIGCHYCGDPIVISRLEPHRTRFLDGMGRSRPELDHVHPLFWDGPHTVVNLVPACLSCNRSKGARRLEVAP